MRNMHTLNVRGFSLAASLLWASSGCFTHSDFSSSSITPFFFFNGIYGIELLKNEAHLQVLNGDSLSATTRLF